MTLVPTLPGLTDRHELDALTISFAAAPSFQSLAVYIFVTINTKVGCWLCACVPVLDVEFHRLVLHGIGSQIRLGCSDPCSLSASRNVGLCFDRVVDSDHFVDLPRDREEGCAQQDNRQGFPKNLAVIFAAFFGAIGATSTGTRAHFFSMNFGRLAISSTRLLRSLKNGSVADHL
jgi:hypothetical protein